MILRNGVMNHLVLSPSNRRNFIVRQVPDTWTCRRPPAGNMRYEYGPFTVYRYARFIRLSEIADVLECALAGWANVVLRERNARISTIFLYRTKANLLSGYQRQVDFVGLRHKNVIY